MPHALHARIAAPLSSMSRLRSMARVFPDGSVLTWTECSECGRRLTSAADWSECKRRHAVEVLHSTPEGRRLFDMLAGLKP